jgi:hypothetical protein
MERFVTIMRHALRPMARPQIHADCFFADLRLLGIDEEIFDKQLKLQINQGALLAGQRRETAAQQGR